MLRGDPRRPWVDINSEKLLRRHLSMVILQEYLTKVHSSLDTISAAKFLDQHLSEFESFSGSYQIAQGDILLRGAQDFNIEAFRTDLVEALLKLKQKRDSHPELFGVTDEGDENHAKDLLDALYEEGIIPEELDKILATTPRVKFIYVIPEFQNPTGVSWTVERRRKFMEVVNKYDLPVFEDDPYGELRYTGKMNPTLKSMDTKGLVSFLGTFSKIFCPGMRLGWIAGPHDIVEKFVTIKQSADLHTSNFDQGIVDAYIDSCDLDAHVEEIKELYGKRLQLILKTMEEEFPEGVTFTRPEGGLFLWVTMPKGVSSLKVFNKCIEMKVAAVIGDAFYPNEKTDRSLRVNYSNMPEDRIIEGIKRMAKAIKAVMAESK